MHACARLLARGDTVVGIDNLNDYYDVRLKQARLERLQGWPEFRFELLDLADRDGIARLFAEHRFERVFNLSGGISSRERQGRPLESSDAPP